MASGGREQRRVRVGLLWAASLVIAVVYFLLPGGEDPVAIEPPAPAADTPTEPRKFEVVQTTPTDGPAGSAVVISFAGLPNGADESQLRAMAGPDELVVLDRHPGSLVARLPAKLEPGRVKIRVL